MRQTNRISYLALLAALGLQGDTVWAQESVKNADAHVTAPDLTASIEQSLADKFLDSVSYPFVVFDKHYPPFPKPIVKQVQDKVTYNPPDGEGTVSYSEQEVRALIIKAYELVERSKPSDANVDPEELALAKGILDAAMATVENIRACIRAYEEAKRLGIEDQWEGPDPQELRKILGSKQGTDAEYLAAINSGWKVKGHLRWLKISLTNRPAAQLNGPEIAVATDGVRAGATAELWVRFKWLRCRRWCTKWETYWVWKKVGRLTVRNVKFKPVDVTVRAIVDGTRVVVRAMFTKLRLDYWILRKIPLKGIGNKALKTKELWVYDAGTLVKTVPILKTKWTVDSVALPPATGRIRIEIGVKQAP